MFFVDRGDMIVWHTWIFDRCVYMLSVGLLYQVLASYITVCSVKEKLSISS